jgi:hypothetical protein
MNESKSPKKLDLLAKMQLWEIVALVVAFSLIAFVALPNYFDSLEAMRGRECSDRLTLVANCLTYLAKQNNTQPGEKICELFDLNEVLALAQGVTYQLGETNTWLYYKVGAEPDCAGEGDHTVSLYLGADGEIVEPTCSIAHGEDGEYYQNRGLHTCNLANVTGEIGIK